MRSKVMIITQHSSEDSELYKMRQKIYKKRDIKKRDKESKYLLDLMKRFLKKTEFYNETLDENQNDLKIFKEYFKSIRQQAHDKKSKSLCIYAVSKKYDENGVILSKYGLESSKFTLKQLKEYNVIPTMFGSKESLIEKIKKFSNRYNQDISLLVLNAHGNSKSVGYFKESENCTIPYLSRDAQIILNSCETARKIDTSIAYKLAMDNPGRTVFGTKKSITVIDIKLKKNEQNRPEVEKVNMFSDCFKTPRKSYTLHLKDQQKQNEKLIQIRA